MSDFIPFNRPYTTGDELGHIAAAVEDGRTAGNGEFCRRCSAWLESSIGSARALLTPSCTGALEIAGILAALEPGDEVLMPSFTFVSTANAIVLRGAVPVFVDIRPDTLNVDEEQLEAAITPRTKAIVVVHYAGVGCEMDRILEVARRHELLVIEDAAQAILSSYKGRPLGSFGELAALSFHETKNVHCGEGGALLVNDPSFVERAAIIQEKGTNRAAFFLGHVDKYTWVDLGSSYLLSDISAAFLWAQLESSRRIVDLRLEIWNAYHGAFEELEQSGLLRRPIIPADCTANGHIYYVLLPDEKTRDLVLAELNAQGVQAVFHYVPLHSSPGGSAFGRASGDLAVTTDASGRLLRLPLWAGMSVNEIERVIAAVRNAVSRLATRAAQ